MALYNISKKTVKALYSFLFKVEVIGLEHTNIDGPVIVCANHISNYDPPLLGITFPQKIHFMAKAELFKVPVLSTLLTDFGAFPVSRGAGDKKALRAGLQILKDGKVLGLFPEGHRSKDGSFGEPQSGVGFFALKSDATVIPCAIISTYKFKKRVRIVYGEPVDLSELKEKRGASKDAAKKIMDEIIRLHDTHKF
ncbi:lysophospholipid acyltransferase family protein [Massilibacterium senegalense]|uniref:lysophospholipid acyltransferase family protein n=1 Tax=Massilibacterium senegalense TaxID=1632858 RepID=UPI00078457D1|nr:lysophospholipid acyltransferase family protein [Massilibacterium senegalense]